MKIGNGDQAGSQEYFLALPARETETEGCFESSMKSPRDIYSLR